jgi:phage terminase small subunit
MSDPNQTDPKHVLPSSPFGITDTRYSDTNNPLLSLPQRDVMLAANQLNEYRYSKLTERQRIFIDLYLSLGFNAAEAAKQSGYCTNIAVDKNYEKACGAVGRRLIKHPAIAIGIQLALNYHAERSKISTDALIKELHNIAMVNMGDYFINDGDGDVRLNMPEDHERDKLSALSEITVETYMEGRGREVKRTKFKTHNKLEAIEKLLKLAHARGDPAVTGLYPEKGATGTVVNVFNIMPVPAGEYLPAPQPIAPSPAMNVTAEDVRKAGGLLTWDSPDKAQKRSLTIDHES